MAGQAERAAHAPHIPQLGRSSLPLPREGILQDGDPRKGRGKLVRFKGSTLAQIKAGEMEAAIRADRARTLPALIDSLTYTQYAAESYEGRTIEPASLPNVPGLPRYGYTIEGNDIEYNGRAFHVDVVLKFQDPGNPNRVVGYSYAGTHWEPDEKGAEQSGTRAPLPPEEAEALGQWSLGLYREREAEKVRLEKARAEKIKAEAAAKADQAVHDALVAEQTARQLAERAAFEQSLRDTVTLIDNGRRGYKYTASHQGTLVEVTYSNPAFGRPSLRATSTSPERGSKPTRLSDEHAQELLAQLRRFYQEKAIEQPEQPAQPAIEQ